MSTKNSKPADFHFPEFGIYMAESRHSDDFRMDWTCHDFPKVLYVWEGTGSLWTTGKKFAINAACVIVIPAGVRHRLVDTPSKPMSNFILWIQNDFIANLATEGGLTTCRIIDHRTLCIATKRLFMDILYEQTVELPGSKVFIIGLVLELLGFLIRWRAGRLQEKKESNSNSHPSLVRVAASIRDLENRFYRPQNLEESAERAGLKPRRYSQLFHSITGESWPTFLRRQRVEHAKRLLAQTDRSLIAVSFECGFEDLSSFYRAFGRIEGMSPNAWRKKERNQRSASS